MNPLEISEVGEVIRRVRRERGLRLEDLADDNISPATISNIERGVPHVNIDKIHYLLEKLDLPLDKLPDLMMGKQRELSELQFKLFSIETLCDIGMIEEALEELEQLNLGDNHPFSSFVYYLKGKCYYNKGQWRRAERAFYNGIRLAPQSPEGKSSNIEATCYYYLALCSEAKNRLEQTIRMADSGIEAFIPDEGRQQVYYDLIYRKALSLRKLGRLGEATKAIEQIWNDIDKMENTSTVIGLYTLRSELASRSGIYADAIQYAEEGLEIARVNQDFSGMFDLWSVLGSIYTSQKNWNKAESCLKMAAYLRDKVSNNDELVRTYIRLGILYINQEKWDEGHEVLTKAIEIGKTLNDVRHLTDALNTMGVYYQQQNKDTEAIPYYEEALELAQKYNYKHRAHKALFNLAKSWENLDKERFHFYLENMYRVQQELKTDEDPSFDQELHY